MNSRPDDPRRYVGVRGWLLVLCVILTVIGPLITVITVVGSYGESARHGDGLVGLRIVTVVDVALSLGLMAFSIHAGIGLWQLRAGAVATAKTYLLCVLAYHGIAALLTVATGLPAEGSRRIVTQVATDLIRAGAGVAIWYSYLSKSKRVKATYSRMGIDPV